ncbi:MAG: hypothetical protein Q9195_007423 [Heterodermia aff. obscurata]
MYTPGLEYAADFKVEHKANEPSLQKVADRKSTTFQRLELYRADQDKFPQEQFQTQWPGQARDSTSAAFTSYESKAKPTLSSRPRGTRKSKFCHIGIIAVIIIITITAASVAGSLAAKKHDSDLQKSTASTAATASNMTSSPIVVSGASSPTSSSTPGIPSSDCSKLNTTFNVLANSARAINANVHFDLKCGHDLKLPLVMAMRAFTFEECINACASQATNAQDASTGCVAAVYKPDSPLTCWLKSSGEKGSEIASIGVDAALIHQD